MSIKIVNTKDNSKTLYSEKHKEHYHSINGAISESEHIFLNLGFNNFKNKNINILEIGYGSALNALLTFKQNKYNQNIVFYHGIDTFPIKLELVKDLHLEILDEVDKDKYPLFFNLWNSNIDIDKNFSLLKQEISIQEFIPTSKYDLIYFDAFSPDTQADMWTNEIFKKIADCTNQFGILVTYCSKGIVKQALRDNGFQVFRKAGPTGKRHVLFATKL